MGIHYCGSLYYNVGFSKCPRIYNIVRPQFCVAAFEIDYYRPRYVSQYTGRDGKDGLKKKSYLGKIFDRNRGCEEVCEEPSQGYLAKFFRRKKERRSEESRDEQQPPYSSPCTPSPCGSDLSSHARAYPWDPCQTHDSHTCLPCVTDPCAPRCPNPCPPCPIVCPPAEPIRLFPIQYSRWQWTKTKDLLHFYALVGLIPLGMFLYYLNVYIGPAQLCENPCECEPYHWEYHRHPLTRFLARYVFASPQQQYEKLLHFLCEEAEKMRIRELENRVHCLMSQRNDYRAWYYRPVTAKYHRQYRELYNDEAMANYSEK